MQEQVQSIADSLRASESLSTAYDSIWGGGTVPTAPISGLQRVMLSDDKIFVVLAVLVTIWIGIIVLILRTDRRISALERSVDDRINDDAPDMDQDVGD